MFANIWQIINDWSANSRKGKIMEGFWFVVPLVILIVGSVFLAKRCNKN
jgi:hypothetical protein